jgi:group I intron endonuclease
MVMIVYEAKFPNGKRYIGLTTKPLERRKIEHKHHSKDSNRKFYNAIRKYGWENVVWKILTTCSSEEQMRDKEKHFIKKFRTLEQEFGYNHREGGDGGRHDEETKRKISVTNSGENNGMHGKAPWNKGKNLSKEHRENLSKSHKGQTPWNKGKVLPKTGPRSEEVKAKISKANSGENNGKAKVNCEIVKEIREMYSTGKYKQKELSEAFGLSRTQINGIVNNKYWRNCE